MKTQVKEAMELLNKEEELNTVVFIKTSKKQEEVEFYSWISLLEQHAEETQYTKIYQNFNQFVNGLSLYSLDSFIRAYNYQKDFLLVIASKVYDPENNRGVEFKIFFEVSSLLEQAREQIILAIKEKEKLLKTYLLVQIDLIEITLNKNKAISLVLPQIQSLLSFDKLTPGELAKFNLKKVEPSVIKKQLAEFINQSLL